jgi:hypothetical protein
MAEIEATGPARGTLAQAARAFGVMLGGPVLLAAGSAACVASTARALAGGRRPGALALTGTAALLAYVGVLRPRIRTWGATPEESAKALPGDDLVSDAGLETMRAVTIAAPVGDVWPWLAQIGQDRGGFYSYEWLENLAGCRLRNADRVHPEWQERAVGETVLLHPANGLTLARFEPGRLYGLEGGWFFVLEPHDGRTRLIVRGRVPRGLASVAYGILLELPHFVMERKMLLGIKARVERAGAVAGQHRRQAD